jgi:hypothetical protein
VELHGPQADLAGDVDDLAAQVVAEHAHDEDVVGDDGGDGPGLVGGHLAPRRGEDHPDGVGAGVDRHLGVDGVGDPADLHEHGSRR